MLTFRSKFTRLKCTFCGGEAVVQLCLLVKFLFKGRKVDRCSNYLRNIQDSWQILASFKKTENPFSICFLSIYSSCQTCSEGIEWFQTCSLEHWKTDSHFPKIVQRLFQVENHRAKDINWPVTARTACHAKISQKTDLNISIIIDVNQTYHQPCRFMILKDSAPHVSFQQSFTLFYQIWISEPHPLITSLFLNKTRWKKRFILFVCCSCSETLVSSTPRQIRR